jgi:hypothetical protein
MRYSPGILKEGLRNTTKNKSSQLISEPKFELGTFWIRSRTANLSSATFDGDNVKICSKQIGCLDIDYIHLGKDRDQWDAYGGLVVNIPFLHHKRKETFSIAERLSDFQE